MDWSGQLNYPRPDYLSSSRKRLAPQLLFKGGVLHAWEKRIAVVLDKSFFDTLPSLEEVGSEKADIGWFVYRLTHDTTQNVYGLERYRSVYTRFNESLEKITRAEPGDMADFVKHLQEKVDEQLENAHPPETETIHAILTTRIDPV